MPTDAPTVPRESEEDGRVAAALAEYQAAVEAGSPPPKAEFLARFPDLAARLADCLSAMEAVRVAVTPPPRPPASSLAVGERLGQFRIVREIGRGGMGVVFAAVEEPLGRQVALKVLPVAGATDGRAVQRFRHEAQAAATLQHPHIVPLFSVGNVGELHYFAMQLIDGESLAEHLRRRGEPTAPPAVAGEDSTRSLPPPAGTGGQETDVAAHAPTVPTAAETTGEFRDAARLIGQAADALQHAHDCGIVHRDVKPANLLVDAGGHLWVADFGLAKLPDSDLTGTKDLMGTVRYMSPEQASGRAVALDGRTDVYSLGVTFYECLVGRPPFAADNRHTLLRMVTEDEPTPPRKRNRAVPRDLETVCLKAMAKDPAERYQTAAAFRDDLQRYLDDRPVEAKPPTLSQRGRKWVKRNRALVTALAITATMAAVVCIGVLAGSNAAIADKQRQTLEALDSQVRAVGAEKAARHEANERLRRSLIDQATAARFGRRPGQRLTSLALLREAAEIRPSEELRHDVMASYRLTDWEVIEPAAAEINHFPPSFFDLVEVSGRRGLAVRRKPGGQVVEQLPFDPTLDTNRTVSPDGRCLLVFENAQAVVWDRTTRRVVATPELSQRNVTLTAWTSDGARLVTVGKGNTIHLYDVRTGDEKATWAADPERTVTAVAVQPNGRQLAIAFGEPTPEVRVCDLFTGRLIGNLRTAGVVGDLLWSRTGSWLAAATSGGLVTLWRRTDSPADKLREAGTVVVGKRRLVRLNDFSPADDLLLVNSFPRTLTLISTHDLEVVTDFTPPSVPEHHFGNVGTLGLGRPGCLFSADGHHIGWGGELRYRVVQPTEVRRLSGRLAGGSTIAFSPDGRFCYVLARGGKTVVSGWSLDDLRSVGTCELPADSQTWLTATSTVWSYQETSREVLGRELALRGLSPDDDPNPVAFTRVPAGIRVTMGSHTFKWWPKTGVVVARAYHPPAARMAGILDTPQDIGRKRVATGGALAGIYIWPPQDPTKVRFLDVGVISDFALDPTGRYISTQQAKENVVKVWDYATGELVQTVDSTTSDELLFSPDGRFLTQYGGGGVAVWRTDTWGRVYDQRRLPVSRPSAVAFSPDSKLFVVGDEDDVVIRRTADFVTCLKWESPGTVSQLAFSPDGRRLIGCAVAGVWAWELDRIRRQLRELKLDWTDDPPVGSSRE